MLIIISILYLLIDILMIQQYPPSNECHHPFWVFFLWTFFGPFVALGTTIMITIEILDGGIFDDSDDGGGKV